MFFLPFSVALFLLLLLLLPALLILIQVGAMELAFAKLGLSPTTGVMIFFISLLGSSINIPIHRRRVIQEDILDVAEVFHSFFGFRFPMVREQILAINVGGAIIPGLLSLYLLMKTPFTATVIATAATMLVAYLLSKPVRGVGITLPAFIPPIVSALMAMLLARHNAAPVAYISGVLGTLLGADILNLRKLGRMGTGIMSIGGAGVFDGIYLVGIIAVLLS